MSDFTHRIEDARQMRARKQASNLQLGLLTSEAKLTNYVDGIVRSAGMIFSAREPQDHTKWENYPQYIKDLQGMYWDEKTREIKWCTMWEYTVSLAFGRSAWFVGPAGLGKSTLQAVWARFWCRSCVKPSYLYGKAIDPIGVLSRDNKLDCIGALCLADINFKTQANSILDHEDLLSLCGVFEPGAISARYGCAQFPQAMRRVFSANMGKYQWTQKKRSGCLFF